MSEYEHIVGKLIPCDQSIESVCREEYGCTEEDLDEYCNTWSALLQDVGYRNHYVIGDKVYSIEGNYVESDGDIFRATKATDNSIAFEVRYYNGGCSFTDAIEIALAKMSKND